jgi:hypothetical protein
MVRKVFLVLVVFLFFIIGVNGQCNEGDTRPCGEYIEGECKQGSQYCINGKWGFCMGQILPEEEECGDGKDNDCDGYIDEGCECDYGDERECSPGYYNETGICEFGFELCTEDGEWSKNCLNYTEPDVEKCGAQGYGNDLDDDCDGEIDEGCLVKKNDVKLHCTNRIKDVDEEGIDCGGSCNGCNDCTNGILEKDEVEVNVDLGGLISDCGGLNCPICPSCNDKNMNQGEEGIDCGGPCGLPCSNKDDEDLDGDGLNLEMELKKGTNPDEYDTDFDGVNDARDAMPLCPNGFCDMNKGENEDNCEEDCKEASGMGILLVVVILVLIAAAIAGFFYFNYKSSSKVLKDKGWKGFDNSTNFNRVRKNSVRKNNGYVGKSSGYRRKAVYKKRNVRESDAEKKLKGSIDEFDRVRRR